MSSFSFNFFEKLFHVLSLLGFVGTMSNLMPMEKLNVFSFAAGFFFLTAAALSAYLLYQEEEEAEARNPKAEERQDIISEQDEIAVGDDDEQTSMQDTDFLEESSETDSELENEQNGEKMFKLENSFTKRRLDVQDSCTTTFSEELDEMNKDDRSHLDQSSMSTSQDETLELFEDHELEDDTPEEFDASESEEEGCAASKGGEASPISPVNVGTTTISQAEVAGDVDVEGPLKVNMMAISVPFPTELGQVTGDQDDCVKDAEMPGHAIGDSPDDFNHSTGDITKLYKMEEDVKISRVNNPSQSEEEEQSTSYLHYSKVTTIGVYGPTEEKDDIEELLKNRTFQGPYSEWIPPHFYSDEGNHEDKCDFKEEQEPSSIQNRIPESASPKAINEALHSSKAKTSTEGMAILDDLDNFLDSYVAGDQCGKNSDKQEGNGDHFPKAFKKRGQTQKDEQLLTKHDNIEEGETSVCKEFLSKKESPVLTEWYAWEKEILGDSFTLDPSGKQKTPVLRRAHSFVEAGQDTSSRDKAVSFNLPGKNNRHNMEKNFSNKPKLRPWCNKPFEPKTPSDLDGGFRNKRTEEIIQRKKYVSPYCHPAKKQVIANDVENK